MKLHLGCGDKHIEGWVNVDCRPLPTVDVVADVGDLSEVAQPNTVDLIYACHVLEYFNRWEYMDVLRNWHTVLKPGGVLRLAVPNWDAIVQWYIQHGELRELLGMLYANPRHGDFHHKMVFSIKLLWDSLKESHFSLVRDWDWRTTEHAHIDDFSQAYLPHMDKQHGMLMSLNLEAVK